MPALPTYIAAHIADAARLTFRLVKFHYAVPQCLTDCDIPIVYDGDTYIPAASLVIGGVQVSRDDQAVGATISVGNCSDYWGALLTSMAGPARNPTVQVFEAWLDVAEPSCVPLDVRGLLVGAVETSSWNPMVAKWTIGKAADFKAATLPYRRIDSRCTYRRFKGSQCGYAGATATCDRSYATCAALANTARFGGFRALPSIDPVEIVMSYESGPTGASVTLSLDRET